MSELIDKLQGKLNTAMGMEYLGDMEDLYAEVLQDYVDSDKTPLLEQYLAEENWVEYRVQIHAVKSTTLMIGGEELSAKAKELEMAAASGDAAYIKGNHAAVMAEYKLLRDTIAAAL